MPETRIEWRRVAVEVLAIVLSILLAFGLEAWWSWNLDRREEQDILFQVVPNSDTAGRRMIDAVILPDGPKEHAHWRDISLEGHDAIVVQAKAQRLGMYLMGQTVFSAKLVKTFRPRSVLSVALCQKDDSVLRPLLEAVPGTQVVVVPQDSLT